MLSDSGWPNQLFDLVLPSLLGTHSATSRLNYLSKLYHLKVLFHLMACRLSVYTLHASLLNMHKTRYRRTLQGTMPHVENFFRSGLAPDSKRQLFLAYSENILYVYTRPTAREMIKIVVDI
jgi:hypothetical protein